MIKLTCSGREFYANGNIIGIDDNGRVFEGYDGNFNDEFSDESDPLTQAEREELSGIMMERWRRFATPPPNPS